MTTGYEFPPLADATKLAAANAAIAAVWALIDTHTAKDGRVPVCQLRKALGGAKFARQCREGAVEALNEAADMFAWEASQLGASEYTRGILAAVRALRERAEVAS